LRLLVASLWSRGLDSEPNDRGQRPSADRRRRRARRLRRHSTGPARRSLCAVDDETADDADLEWSGRPEGLLGTERRTVAAFLLEAAGGGGPSERLQPVARGARGSDDDLARLESPRVPGEEDPARAGRLWPCRSQ